MSSPFTRPDSNLTTVTSHMSLSQCQATLLQLDLACEHLQIKHRFEWAWQRQQGPVTTLFLVRRASEVRHRGAEPRERYIKRTELVSFPDVFSINKLRRSIFAWRYKNCPFQEQAVRDWTRDTERPPTVSFPPGALILLGWLGGDSGQSRRGTRRRDQSRPRPAIGNAALPRKMSIAAQKDE